MSLVGKVICGHVHKVIIGGCVPLLGETESAQLILQRITEKDSTSMESHLLMAKIQLHRGNIKQCSASLELALSSNFEVTMLNQPWRGGAFQWCGYGCLGGGKTELW